MTSLITLPQQLGSAIAIVGIVVFLVALDLIIKVQNRHIAKIKAQQAAAREAAQGKLMISQYQELLAAQRTLTAQARQTQLELQRSLKLLVSRDQARKTP